MEFRNDYQDARRAAAYDELALGGTYHLAFRDLPARLTHFVSGRRALDFGCGTGRSTRWLRQLGFETVGIDVSSEMLDIARRRDPSGDYRLIADGDLGGLPLSSYDVVLSAFTFDNIPGRRHRLRMLCNLRALLGPQGLFVNIVSRPEIYVHEWATFSTRDYPENRSARSGDIVRIVTTDYSDARPVEDILWSHEDYMMLYRGAGLRLLQVDHPVASGEEGIRWKSETKVAPWAIYQLAKRVP